MATLSASQIRISESTYQGNCYVYYQHDKANEVWSSTRMLPGWYPVVKSKIPSEAINCIWFLGVFLRICFY